MKVLVTGAGKSGFVGYHVRKEFNAKEFNAIAFYDFEYINMYYPTEVVFVGSSDYDLTSLEETHKMYDDIKPDVVVHMAAVCGGILANKKRPADFIAKNTRMNVNIYEGAWKHAASRRGMNKDLFVYTIGSVCAYPVDCPTPFKEDDLFNGFPECTNAPYGLAKRNLFAMGNAFREQWGIKGAHLIPGNMFGEMDHFDLTNSHVIPALIYKFSKPRLTQRSFHNKDGSMTNAIPVWGTGKATREFLYAGDCAKAIFKAVTQKLDTPLPINIGTGCDISIKELAYLIAKLTGYDGDIMFTGEVSDGQPKRRLDVTRAKEMLGFEASVGLEEGLKRTIKWYEENLK